MKNRDYKKVDRLYEQSIADSKMMPFYPDAIADLPQKAMSKIFDAQRYVDSLGKCDSQNDIGLTFDQGKQKEKRNGKR
jgi:hypothetical protein